tara:strand:- start:3397 stop:5034 length:1638 start_codon:yes stop_codon:yes gene_type:complete
MNSHLKSIVDLTNNAEGLTAEERESIAKAIKAMDKELTILEFKLERTEKVKRTTSILLEETIEELEQKRKVVEDLALEASRQASLDRIRAEIASMRSAEDLQQITPLIWDELKNLNIPFIRCGVFIMDEEKKIIHTYLSTPKGDSIAVLHLPFEGISLAENALASWRDQKIYLAHWNEEDFTKWAENLIKLGFIQSKEKYEAGDAPENLELHFLPFKQGMLYIGNSSPLSDESLDLGKSLSEAFSLAYDRYEDFNKLEISKRNVDAALKKLRATQQQLIQQEKLASLGQLTAGIAHEIKNPLNFVNNFSELSVELIEEINEELSAVSDQLSAEDRKKVHEALEILADIETNLRKIHEHGSRADSIVKSMLEHSRGGSGKLEPTDLNALVKEFVNLSFHGMRAGKNPINVDLNYELDETIGEVPLIAEDFSRVIVNLCNNAFDAMREKLSEKGKGKSEKYTPKLIVRIFTKNQATFIEIEDNALGIPDAIKDKILQPFFTTKKGTEGTGLGLSITNDIIKAHGGVLEVSTNQNEGTCFTIKLSEDG